MGTERRKRLIEVAFPLEEVSAESRKDPYLGPPHPSALHKWWARRPLAACRAFIYASLIDDPEDDREREELLKEIADLASWDAVRNPDRVVRPRDKGGSGLTGRQLLERARQRILDCNGGAPPRLLDPFAGGGAIPLEALRLGCQVEASDLNPVAVLILKGTVEYPQKYGRPLAEQKARGGAPPPAPGVGAPPAAPGDGAAGADIAGVDGDVPRYITDAAKSGQSSFIDGDLAEAYRKNPLATDVRYWGNWMLERAREELAEFYPPDPGGSVPVAYLWSRTVPCPNCGAEMPLIRQYWLARKDKKKVALKPVIDRENKRVDFEVVEGPNITGDPAEATTTRGDTLCLLCRQVVKAEYIRNAGVEGKIGARLTAVVLEARGSGGKRYRADAPRDIEPFRAAESRLNTLQAAHVGEVPLVPDEPMPRHLTGGVITAFGYDTFGKLFNDRQLLALTTFARLVREAHGEMLAAGLGPEYAKAVATYLGLAVDRHSAENCSMTRWNPRGEKAQGALGLQALPMVWDYAELNPWCGSVGDISTAVEITANVVEHLRVPGPGMVLRRDGRERAEPATTVVTDPPYYDAINYADLSDFFYVWLKRSVGFLHPDLLLLPLTPKKEQIVMNVYANPDGEGDRREAARQHYVNGMAAAFAAMRQSLEAEGVAGIVFAHTDPDAWGTLIEGLLHAGLVPDASWPIDTESGTKIAGMQQARLKTSVWMACRPRRESAAPAFLDDVIREMRPVIRERLLYFWSKGIRGADFFISGIGPALSVFGKHTRVMYPDGKDVSVRDFLDLVRREATNVALEQVLYGADLGVVDPITRQYVTWVWSYSRAPLDAGEAIALCLATGADYGEVVRPGSIAAEVKDKSKKLVKLRTIRERGEKEEDLGLGNGARPVPLIDQLQRAAYLWSLTRTDQLAAYRASLGETRWTALRTLGQAVAECLPDGDEDRRLILGLLGSNVMAATPRDSGRGPAEQPGRTRLPGFDANVEGGGEG